MSDAQAYYDGLIAQGYTPDQAKQYTQQYYAGFEPAAPQVAPVADFQVDQTHVQAVAQEHGVDATQLVETARHFDANQDGILQQSELEATAQQMTSTAVPAAPAPVAAAPMAAPAMAAAPAMGMPAPGMAAAPAMGMPAPGMAAPMGGMPMMPAPAAAAGETDKLMFAAVACIVLTLVFSVMGLFMDSWLTDVGDDDSKTGMGLGTMTIDCSEVDGDEEKQTCGTGAYTLLHPDPEDVDLPDEVPVENSGDISTFCTNAENFAKALAEAFGAELDDDAKSDFESCHDTASAGETGGYILWVAAIAGLGAAVLIIFNTFGIGALPVDTQKFGFIAGVAAGALAGLAVLIWYIMLPSDGDMDAGMNVWLTITGALTGIGSGVLTKLKGNPMA